MLHYERIGDGEQPWILMHGFLGSGRNIKSLARGLQRRFPTDSCWLPDHLGHGQSPNLPEQAKLRHLSDALCNWFDREVRPQTALAPILVGHSMGARVALKASKHLSPSALVLLDMSPDPTVKFQGELERLFHAFLNAPAQTPDKETMRNYFLQQQLARPLVDWILLNTHAADEQLRWRIDRKRIQDYWEHGAHEDLWHVLQDDSALAHSTLVLVGEKSTFVPERQQHRLQELGATVQTIPKAGHFVHAENLSGVLDAVIDFISETAL